MPRNVTTIEPKIGRRAEARLRVRLAARLISRDGNGRAVLIDLSQHGARVSGVEPDLRPGHEAVLKWGAAETAGHEAFGVIVWSAHGECGINFYDPVDRAALIQTRAIDSHTERRADRVAVREVARAFVSGQRRL